MKKTRDSFRNHFSVAFLADLALWTLLCGGISWLFYQSWIAFFIGLPAFPFFLKYRRKEKERQEKARMKRQFIDGMTALYSSLSAGNPLEVSFRNARKDLEIYDQGHEIVRREFTFICAQLDKNIPLENSLTEMAGRCQDEDIRQLAEILILAKRSGGAISRMVRESMERIQRRMETSYEIEAMLGAKKSEFHIMCLIPAGIIVYMKLFSAEFMAVLYHNAAGAVFMTVCLAVYMAGIFWGRKLLDIRV